ncbi:MAG: riboflavin synthase [Kiloniellales bacterium]
MFTGIVALQGRIKAAAAAPTGKAGDRRIEIAADFADGPPVLGASVACSGICLTVIETGPGWFAVEVSAETLGRTTLGRWQVGTAINLERPLKLGEELGGHMVSGHVDGLAVLSDRRPEGGSLRLAFEAPAPLARFIAPKGSVALDGVSLTVNEVIDRQASVSFGVNIIPHTAEVTSLGALREGDPVNLEIDLVARYLQRLSGKDR